MKGDILPSSSTKNTRRAFSIKKQLLFVFTLLLLTLSNPVLPKRFLSHLFDRYAYSNRDFKDCEIRLANAPYQNGRPIIAYSVTCAHADASNYIKVESLDYLIDSSQPEPVQLEARDSKRIYTAWVYNVYDVVVSEKRDYFRTIYGIKTYGTNSSYNEYNIVIRMKQNQHRIIRYRLYGNNWSQQEGHGMILSPCEKFLYIANQDYLVMVYLWTFLHKGEDYNNRQSLSSSEIYAHTMSYEGCRYSTSCRYENWEWRYGHAVVQDMQFSPFFYSNGENGGSSRKQGSYNYDMSMFIQTNRYTKYQNYNSQGIDNEHDRGIHIDRIKFAFHSIDSMYHNQSWNRQVVAVKDTTVVINSSDTRMSERPWLPRGRFGVDHRNEEEYQVVLVYQQSKAPNPGEPCQLIMTHTDMRETSWLYEKLSYISIPTDSYYKELNPNMPDLTQNNLVCGVAPSRQNALLSTTRREARWFVFLCDNTGGFARITIDFKNAGVSGPYTYEATIQAWNPSRTMKANSDKFRYARQTESRMYANDLQFVKYNYRQQPEHTDPLYNNMFLFAQKKDIDLEGRPSAGNYPSYFIYSEINRAQNMTDATFWAPTPEYRFSGTTRLTFPVTVIPQSSSVVNYQHVQYTSLHTHQRLLRSRWTESGFYHSIFRWDYNMGYTTSNYPDVTASTSDVYPADTPRFSVENHQSWQIQENKAKTLMLEDPSKLQKIDLYEGQYLIILDEQYIVNEWSQYREFANVWEVVKYTQKMLDEQFGGGVVYLEQAGPNLLNKMDLWYNKGSDLRAEIAFMVEKVSGPTWVECNAQGERQRASNGKIEMGYAEIDGFKLRQRLQPEILPMKWAKHIYKMPHKTYPDTETNCLMYLYTTHMMNGQNRYIVENELGMRVMSKVGKPPGFVEEVVENKAPYLEPVPERKVIIKPGEDFKIDLGEKVDPEFKDTEMVVDLSGARAFSTYDERSNIIEGTAPVEAKATGYRIDITIREILAKDKMSKYIVLLTYDDTVLAKLTEELELKLQKEEAEAEAQKATNSTETESDAGNSTDSNSVSTTDSTNPTQKVEDQINEIQRIKETPRFGGVSTEKAAQADQNALINTPFKEIPVVTTQVQEFLFQVRDPEPKLAPVQNDGKAKIKFNQKIRWPESVLKLLESDQTNEERKAERQRNLQEDDFEILTLKVLTNEEASAKDLGVEWRATEITPYSFNFELLFSNPMVVSQGDEPDKIEVSINMSQIVDEYGQSLPDQVEIIEVPRQVRSTKEKELINEAGQFSTQVIGGIILANIFFCLILATSLNQLWIMINGLQIATHLPLLNVKFPANANLFTYVYLLIAKMDFVPDSFLQGYLVFPESEAYSLEFATNGYASQYAVENISTAFVLLQSYLLLCLLTAFLYCCQWLSPNFKILYIKVRQFTFWAAILRFLMEFYLEIGLAVSIGVQKIDWNVHTLPVYYSNAFTYLFVALLLILPFFVFMFYSSYAGKMNQTAFYQKWGNLYDGLTLDKKFENRVKVLFYPVLFILRRQVFIALAIFLQKYLALQLVGAMLTSLGMIYYVQLCRPFANNFLNSLETFNEVTTMLLLYTIVCFTDNVQDAEIKYMIGWVYIGITGFNVLVHILLLIKQTLMTIHDSVCLVNRQKMKEDKRERRKKVMLEKGKKRLVFVAKKKKQKKNLEQISEEESESDKSSDSYDSDQISELPPYRGSRKGGKTPRRNSKQVEMKSFKQDPNESKRKLVNRSTDSLESVTDITEFSSPTKNSIFTRNSSSNNKGKTGNKGEKEPTQYPNVMFMPNNYPSPQKRFSQQNLSPSPLVNSDKNEIQKYSAFVKNNFNDIEELGPGDSVSHAGEGGAGRNQGPREDPSDEIDRRFFGENLNDPEIRSMYIQQRQIEVLRNLAVLGVIRPGQINDVMMPEQSLKRKAIMLIVKKQYGDSQEPNWFINAEKRLDRELKEKPFLRGEESHDTQRMNQPSDLKKDSKKKKKVVVVKRKVKSQKSQLISEADTSYILEPSIAPPIPAILNDQNLEELAAAADPAEDVKKAQRKLRRAATMLSRQK